MNYSIWVTAKCNLGCKYCYEGNEKLAQSMSLEIAREVVQYIERDYMRKYFGEELVINFHGGEPLLEVDLIYFFIKEIKKRNLNKEVYFSLTTNVTIMNDDIVNLLKDEQVEMTLSIDGMRETHDKLRIYKNGLGTHKTVMKNAEQILKISPNVRVRMTYDSETVYELEKNIKYLIDIGFHVIVPIENQFDTRWKYEDLEILEKTITNIKQYIAGTTVGVGICDPIENRNKGKCRGGISGKHIYINGDIYPCMMVGGKEEFRIGNIHEGIRDEKIKKILSYSEHEHKECGECQVKQVCDGNRCKIINKLVTGNYVLPSEIQCSITNSIYKLNGRASMC